MTRLYFLTYILSNAIIFKPKSRGRSEALARRSRLSGGGLFRRKRMDKAHHVQKLAIAGTILHLEVDGKKYEIDIAKHSDRLARATQEQREKYEISPSGYGIHWPDIDEDLSIDGLIGVKHASPVKKTFA
jgi:hypothetical protein